MGIHLKVRDSWQDLDLPIFVSRVILKQFFLPSKVAPILWKENIWELVLWQQIHSILLTLREICFTMRMEILWVPMQGKHIVVKTSLSFIVDCWGFSAARLFILMFSRVEPAKFQDYLKTPYSCKYYLQGIVCILVSNLTLLGWVHVEDASQSLANMTWSLLINSNTDARAS